MSPDTRDLQSTTRDHTYVLGAGLLSDDVGLVVVVVFLGSLAFFVGGGTTTTPADAYLNRTIYQCQYILGTI